jgi:hypothetical protein
MRPVPDLVDLLILDLLAIRIGSGRDVGGLRERVEDTIERRKVRSRSCVQRGNVS